MCIYVGSRHRIQYVGIWFRFVFFPFLMFIKLFLMVMMKQMVVLVMALLAMVLLVMVLQQKQMKVSISVTKWNKGSLLPTD